MKQAIIIHGTSEHEEYFDKSVPSSSNNHWIAWLQKQLIVRGVHSHTPEIPDAWKPVYPLWKTELERFQLNTDTALVGHSCGGGFLIRWLTEHPEVKVGNVILVAPWLDPDRRKTTDFFDFEVDPLLSNRASRLTIFHSDDDMEEVQKSVRYLRKTLKDFQYKEFKNFGHFCLADMKTTEFPELLDAVLSD
jgi:predicted alpha/beta hydrolase family esterase